MKRIVKIRIHEKNDGTALIDLLTRRFTYHDRERWEERIAEQRLLVNDAPARSDTRLQAGNWRLVAKARWSMDDSAGARVAENRARKLQPLRPGVQ